MNLLITAGATREPIDDVRFISNVSTGATGAALAIAFADAGHQVTLLRGIGAVTAAGASARRDPAPPLSAGATGKPRGSVVGAALRRDPNTSDVPPSPDEPVPPKTPAPIEELEFTSAGDLGEKLGALLAPGRFDAVVMTAAVADYRVARPAAGKLSSSPERMTLELVRNPKLLPQLKALSPRPTNVIGFKLTSGADDRLRRSAVDALFASAGVDLVVHNDLAEIRSAPAAEHPFWIHRSRGSPPERVLGASALAAALLKVLETP